MKSIDVTRCHRLGRTARTLASIAVAASSAAAHSQPVTAIDTFNFIDNRQASIFGPAGERISVGGDFSPAAGTTVTATQGTRVVNVPYLDSPALPNEFFSSIAYGPSLTGAWTIQASNPSYTPFSSQTNSLYAGPLTPFIQNAATNNLSTTPTFTWTQPAYSAPPGTRPATSFFLMNQGGTVLLRASLPSAATQFSVPATFNGTALQVGKNYVISLQTTLFDATTGAELETSRSYFDYVPSATPASFPGPVNLPQVDADKLFTFRLDVSTGVPVLLDPVAATGYVFHTGASDPLFQSVELPLLGDSRYEIDSWNGAEWVKDASVPALTRYTFAGLGVDQFRVLGIDPALALDPADTTAFEASVTFAGDGQFTGTMSAITASVPEPPVQVLWTLGLGIVGTLRPIRSRHRTD